MSKGFFSTKTVVVSATPFVLVFLRLPLAVTVYSVKTEELAADEATLLLFWREILSSAADILLQGKQS